MAQESFDAKKRPASEFLEQFAMTPSFLQIAIGTDDGSVADKFTPDELDFMTSILAKNGPPAHRAAVQMSQSPSERIYPPDAVEAIPSVGGMVGQTFGGPLGAGLGGGSGELLRQFLQGEEFSLSDAGLEAALQAAPGAALKAGRPLMEKTVGVSRKVRDLLPETRPNPTGGDPLLTSTERPTADLMTRFGLRPGRQGINRTADIIERLKPGSNLPVRDMSQIGRPPNYGFGEVTGADNRSRLREAMKGVEKNILSESEANLGGASSRDVMRNVLQSFAPQTSTALRAAESMGVDQAARGMMGLDDARQGARENFRRRQLAP